MNNEEIIMDFEKLYNPQIIKKNLIKGSLYLTAFELLRFAVEKRIRNFLCSEQPMDENFEYQNSPDYISKILNRKIRELKNKKDIFYSSCLWLKENNVITKEDVEELQKIKSHRNEIGHELPTLLVDNAYEINLDLLESIRNLLAKIERWWIVEYEMTFNLDYDNIDFGNLDTNDVRSGNMILLNHIIDTIKEELE